MYDVLIQRIMRIEKHLVRTQARADRLQKEIDDLYVERGQFLSDPRSTIQPDGRCPRTALSPRDRLFPNMGPMLDRIEAVVGNFDQWQTNNPLDRRQKDS